MFAKIVSISHVGPHWASNFFMEQLETDVGINLKVTHFFKVENSCLIMSDPVWYKDGLQFQCTQCGGCCSGDPGVVWVDQEEIKNIAKFTGLTETELRLRHTRSVGRKITLTERDDGDCSFLDKETRRCQIYSVRPKQCRTWPFWNSNLQSPEAWEETQRVCPGAGKGNFVPLEEIQRQAAIIDI